MDWHTPKEVIVSSALSKISLVPGSRVVKDSALTLNTDEVVGSATGTRVPEKNEFISFGFSSSAYWFHVPFNNTDPVPLQKILVFEPTWLDDVQVTLIQDGRKIQEYQGGDFLPFASRTILHPNTNVNLSLPTGQSQLLVRIQSQDPVVVGMTLYERSAFFESDVVESKYWGLTYGILGALLLYNLFLFLSVRDKIYVAYAAYLFSFLIMHATLNGRAYQEFWPEAPVLNNYALAAFVYLYMLAGLLFAILFLDLRTKLVAAYRLAMVFVMLLVATYLATAAFGGYGQNIFSATALVILYGPFIVLLGAWSLWKGNRAARFFLIGTVSGFIGSCITPLTTSGIISFSFFTYRAVDFGMVIDAILLSFALADRIAVARQEKELAQMKLKTNDERWRLALESAGEGVWDWNVPSGEVTYSRRWKEMLGYSENEIGNNFDSWKKLVHPLDQPQTFSNVQALLADPQKGYRNEFRLRCKDGTWKWVLAQGAVVERNAHGGPVRIIGTHIDISENKLLEKSVRDMNEQLEMRVEQRTRELALAKDESELASLSKTRFLASAGHDLRQPVAAANLFVDALKLTSPTPRQGEIITRLEQSMNIFSNLLESLLNISKFDAGLIKPEFKSVNLAGIFNWLEQNFAQSALDKGLRLRIFLPEKQSLVVRADMGLLQSALLNLLSNAIKFTERGGILIGARLRGDHVSIQIWDTGIGISADNLANIFDEFYQVDNPQRNREAGLGLGLSICRRAATLLEGEIKCRARLGSGSVFELILPLDDAQNWLEPLPADIMASNIIDAEFLRGKCAVVIEDDVLVADGLISLLRELEVGVLHFGSAEEALCHADITHADFYIVDYMLGESLSGIQFLARLDQKSGRPIKAVVVTGDTSPDFVRKSAECAWPVLYKPVKKSRLIACLMAQ